MRAADSSERSSSTPPRRAPAPHLEDVAASRVHAAEQDARVYGRADGRAEVEQARLGAAGRKHRVELVDLDGDVVALGARDGEQRGDELLEEGCLLGDLARDL